MAPESDRGNSMPQGRIWWANGSGGARACLPHCPRKESQVHEEKRGRPAGGLPRSAVPAPGRTSCRARRARRITPSIYIPWKIGKYMGGDHPRRVPPAACCAGDTPCDPCNLRSAVRFLGRFYRSCLTLNLFFLVLTNYDTFLI